MSLLDSIRVEDEDLIVLPSLEWAYRRMSGDWFSLCNSEEAPTKVLPGLQQTLSEKGRQTAALNFYGQPWQYKRTSESEYVLCDPSQKPDAETFLEVVNENGIKNLYHWTDARNLESILDARALMPSAILKQASLAQWIPGGDAYSLDRDVQLGLDHFVHLCFTPWQPMRLRNHANNIDKQYAIFEVSTDVVAWLATEFTDRNASDGTKSRGNSLEHLNAIRFNIATADRPYGYEERKLFQAEVMVAGMIPLQYVNRAYMGGIWGFDDDGTALEEEY